MVVYAQSVRKQSNCEKLGLERSGFLGVLSQRGGKAFEQICLLSSCKNRKARGMYDSCDGGKDYSKLHIQYCSTVKTIYLVSLCKSLSVSPRVLTGLKIKAQL